MIPSLIVFSPNKSKGWLLLIIYLLQVRQTENRIPSAILFRFLPVIIFIVFPSDQSVARTDWNRPELSIRGAGQEDRSSGNENAQIHANMKSTWRRRWKTSQSPLYSHLKTQHVVTCCKRLHTSANIPQQETTLLGPTMLRVVASVCTGLNQRFRNLRS